MEKVQDRQSDKQVTGSFTDRLLNTVKGENVTAVFGEPVQLDDKKVIPVARVRVTGGGGGGLYGEQDTAPDRASGGGGGGYLSVRPFGVYEISGQGTRFKPAYTLNALVLIFSVFTLGMVFLLRKFLK
ncbi:spore germination protein GerW family protein [Sporolactobacillus sp. THM19-2]|uniref:spore germination protein GerW family protein n=1 Tax=Sporolactobacillus sp. THM19-2 TaxID=2511171 RepID=UPI0013EB7DE2|nr:spore germination protein GerW family protein [Sporolactobacillus sp. THM19-2]